MGEFAAEPESISVDWLKLKSQITSIVVVFLNVKETVCELVVYGAFVSDPLACIGYKYVHALYSHVDVIICLYSCFT